MDGDKISAAIAKVMGEMFPKTQATMKTEFIALKTAQELSNEIQKEAQSRGMKVVVAVVNAAGNPVSVNCMDGSYIASYNVALNKAYTSAILKMPTAILKDLAAPGADLYGIQFTNDGRIVIFGGGEPLEINGNIIGAVGVSGGTADQDTQLAVWAKNKFKEMQSWHLTKE